MDTNLVNCMQCGHSVSQTATACAYCGAVVSEGEPTLQNDESIAAEEVASVEPALTLQKEVSPAVVEKIPSGSPYLISYPVCPWPALPP